VSCADTIAQLGFLRAIQCAAGRPLVQTIYKVANCTLGVATFLAPAGKIAKLVDDVGTYATARTLAAKAGTSTPVAELAVDLYTLARENAFSFRVFKATFDDARSLPGFLGKVTDMLRSARHGDVSEIALDIANLTGLGSCVDLLAQVIAPAPAPASPTPAPAPAPSQPALVIPASGPTLAYTGATADNPDTGDTSFTDFAAATSQNVDVVDALPTTLSGYRCAILDVNTAFSPADISVLQAYLDAGGTVLALGEHSGGAFDTADSAINALADDLGASAISLNDDDHDDGDNDTTAIAASPWTAGVSDLMDNWVSSLTVNPPAEVLVGTADDGSPLVGAESVGDGTFVLSGDSNMFTDNNDGFFDSSGNAQFAADLCP